MSENAEEAVAWIKPDWRDPATFDGTSPVTVYKVAGWTPLYEHPIPAPLSGRDGSLREAVEIIRRYEAGGVAFIDSETAAYARFFAVILELLEKEKPALTAVPPETAA